MVVDLKILNWSKGLSIWDWRQRLEVYSLGHLEDTLVYSRIEKTEVEHFHFLLLIPILCACQATLASLVSLCQWLGLGSMGRDDLEETVGYYPFLPSPLSVDPHFCFSLHHHSCMLKGDYLNLNSWLA